MVVKEAGRTWEVTTCKTAAFASYRKVLNRQYVNIRVKRAAGRHRIILAPLLLISHNLPPTLLCRQFILCVDRNYQSSSSSFSLWFIALCLALSASANPPRDTTSSHAVGRGSSTISTTARTQTHATISWSSIWTRYRFSTWCWPLGGRGRWCWFRFDSRCAIGSVH